MPASCILQLQLIRINILHSVTLFLYKNGSDKRSGQRKPCDLEPFLYLICILKFIRVLESFLLVHMPKRIKSFCMHKLSGQNINFNNLVESFSDLEMPVYLNPSWVEKNISRIHWPLEFFLLVRQYWISSFWLHESPIFTERPSLFHSLSITFNWIKASFFSNIAYLHLISTFAGLRYQ